MKTQDAMDVLRELAYIDEHMGGLSDPLERLRAAYERTTPRGRELSEELIELHQREYERMILEQDPMETVTELINRID